MIRAQPLEFVIGNVARRILHLIREEYRTISRFGGSSGPSSAAETPKVTASTGSAACVGSSQDSDSPMYNMLAHPNYNTPLDYNRELLELSQTIPAGIQELMDEIDSSRSNIAGQALEHIHSNEIIMALGRSETVEQFLLAAARKRQFQVIIAEAAPKCSGHVLAHNLATAGVDTILIPDAAIFAMMARVNKVIIGCHAVTANGGLIGISGAQVVASAARYHSTPVCILAPMYKLTPVFPENDDTFNQLANPDNVFPYEEEMACRADVINPLYDYVSPQLVSLLITNV